MRLLPRHVEQATDGEGALRGTYKIFFHNIISFSYQFQFNSTMREWLSSALRCLVHRRVTVLGASTMKQFRVELGLLARTT